MIQYFKIKCAENAYFALLSINIGSKFWTHAAKANLKDFFPE